MPRSGSSTIRALVAAVQASLRERGIAVAGRASRTRRSGRSYDDTVATWSLALGAVVGPAVILIALLVLLVLAVTGWRDRARDLAILRLNGAGGARSGGWPCWAQLPAVLLAVVAGVAAGLVGAALAMPDVRVLPRTAGGARRRPGDLVAGRPVVAAAACAVLLPAGRLPLAGPWSPAGPPRTREGEPLMTGLAIRTRGLVHIYHAEGHDVAALSGVDLDVAAGEMVGLLGPVRIGQVDPDEPAGRRPPTQCRQGLRRRHRGVRRPRRATSTGCARPRSA